MSYFRYNYIIAILALSVALCASICVGSITAFAGEDELLNLKPDQPIVVDGDEVEFFEEQNKIVAKGNVVITYKDIKLTCDRVEVNTTTRRALCEGNVRIEQPDGVLTGEHIFYDFVAKKGNLSEIEVEAFPWFGSAEETSKVGENEYLLRQGFVTTCDLDKPHYRIKAGEIKIFPDDKIIAKNAIFYIGKVPVLWFPYYYHPIIQSRSKVQFIPGQSTDWGKFILSSWRFYITGETKIDVLLDYRSRKGFAEGINLYYDTADFGMAGLGDGLFRTYLVHENKWGTYEKKPFRDEWRDKTRNEGIDSVLRRMYQWKHRIDFDPNTVGMLEFQRVHDENFLKDYFFNEYEENNPIPPNYFSIVSTNTNYTVSLEIQKRINRFYTVTQKLPEFKLTVPNQRLGKTLFYYNTIMSATAFDRVLRQRENTVPADFSNRINRFDSFHKLSYVVDAGPITFIPYSTFEETVYDRKSWDRDQNVTREVFGGGLDASSRLYRVFNVNTNLLGLDINELRHIISPTAKYFFTFQPDAERRDVFVIDTVDSIGKSNGVTLSLENKLQTKRRNNSGELKSTDLVRFIVSTDYLFRMAKDDFDLKKTGPYRKHGRFKNFNIDLELQPYSWLFWDGEMEILPENQAVNTGSMEVSLHPWENFRMGMGYRYEKLNPEPRNQLTFDMSYIVNSKWKLGWYERVNFQRREVEEQQISITRDLHCWEVELVYNVEGSRFFKDEFSLWVAFKIKAFPDLQLGLNRTFSKRPPGSLAPGSDPM